MKKNKLFSLALGASLLLLNSSFNSVHAAGSGNSTTNLTNQTTGYQAQFSENATATSTAELAINPGTLTLDAVPDLRFSSTNINQIATGETTLDLLDGNITKNSTAFDGNSSHQLQVSDLRGNSGDWKLTAQLSEFRSASGETLPGVIMLLNVTTGQGATHSTTPAIITPNTMIFANSSASIVARGNDTTGKGINNYTLNTSGTKTQLIIPKTSNAKAKTYQADITWVLSTTYSAPSAF